jgi:DNA-binding MarR family transcriptional regulator/GNAT superfamily N-acetyltransferase
VPEASPVAPRTVAQVREFNRFYTRVIGVLEAGIVGTPYSLTEARVLYELAERDEMGVSELRRLLGIDAGYLSRILRRFSADGLAVREAAHDDGRRQVVRLTEPGRAAYERIDARQVVAVERLLEPIGEDGRQRLVAAMDGIRRALGGATPPQCVVLRAPAPGELGWMVARHGALADPELGRPVAAEAVAARLVAGFASREDPREAAWIAEVDGDPAGCVLCLAGDDAGGVGAATSARLELLLVEPAARGAGIGSRLVTECVRFARTAGFDRITGCASAGSPAARVLERAGFERSGSERWIRSL